ncbi:MAG TPA: hypothetical protein VHF51_15195 [Solirubrobacteraceae bacterium]|nr:hypothetical protein [Solirubrobacteraceae bacterium]
MQVAVFGAATAGLLALGRTGRPPGFGAAVLVNARLMAALGH